MEFQQSRTYKNILTSYSEELMASTKMSIYSDTARQEGFIEISNIFETVSRNDKEHSRIWLRKLYEGVLPNTSECLQIAAEEERTNKYREFANIAREEGYDDIAALFNGIANIDLNNASLFNTLYNNIEQNEVFCKPKQTLWQCMQCGNIMNGDCAPDRCPVCGFPQGFYKLYDNNS